MTSFNELGVSPKLIDVLERRGVTEPFPIQTMTIRDGLAGRDLSGRASTGSGKTLAFSIPLATAAGKGAPRKPRALVLVPTRELAAQVAEELKPLAGALGRSVTTFYGGTSIGKDQGRLRRGVDIAVACPGRMADLVRRGDADLSDVTHVVLDEADRMADMGFLPEVTRLLDLTRSDRQTLLFSATLDGDVDVLVRRYQRDPVRHELDVAEEDLGDVRHFFWRADQHERVGVTRDLVRQQSPAIVFTRTKHGADRLAKQLAREDGVRAAAIHGNRSQGQRQRALADFSAGRVNALIATDVAARGIHVDDVGVVVHYDPPETGKDYVHRSGRTGRAGADGLVVTLVVPDKIRDVNAMQRSLAMETSVGSVAFDSLEDANAGGRPGEQPAPVSQRSGGRPGGGGAKRGGAKNGGSHKNGGNHPNGGRRNGGPGKGSGAPRGGDRHRGNQGSRGRGRAPSRARG